MIISGIVRRHSHRLPLLPFLCFRHQPSTTATLRCSSLLFLRLFAPSSTSSPTTAPPFPCSSASSLQSPNVVVAPLFSLHLVTVPAVSFSSPPSTTTSTIVATSLPSSSLWLHHLHPDTTSLSFLCCRHLNQAIDHCVHLPSLLHQPSSPSHLFPSVAVIPTPSPSPALPPTESHPRPSFSTNHAAAICLPPLRPSPSTSSAFIAEHRQHHPPPRHLSPSFVIPVLRTTLAFPFPSAALSFLR